ncbi:molybdenum cofactor guanylyltransferase [Natronobiforma cellulositropha]|uniref:molybdenum cofactor guanylyltransferase n=1 Tax=Natronobiforma cellulositropha TaxID=1679076 RepID=UPI0021D58682|nr:molybdenum cofactor guanylyltransferase [Natronobiforma cellulositropha]
MDALIVLAGGRSERFDGGPKALASIDGTPMVGHVVARLAALTHRVVISARAEQHAPLRRALAPLESAEACLDLAFAADDVPDCGPVYGVSAGVSALTAQWPATFDGSGSRSVGLVACDLPLVESVLFERLETALVETGVDAVVPETDDGYAHPLAGVYRLEPLCEAVAAVRPSADETARRQPGLFDVLSGLETCVVGGDDLPADAARMLSNVNTREALESVRESVADSSRW